MQSDFSFTQNQHLNTERHVSVGPVTNRVKHFVSFIVLLFWEMLYSPNFTFNANTFEIVLNNNEINIEWEQFIWQLFLKMTESLC